MLLLLSSLPYLLLSLSVLDHQLYWDLSPTSDCWCLIPDVLDLDLCSPRAYFSSSLSVHCVFVCLCRHHLEVAPCPPLIMFFTYVYNYIYIVYTQVHTDIIQILLICTDSNESVPNLSKFCVLLANICFYTHICAHIHTHMCIHVHLHTRTHIHRESQLIRHRGLCSSSVWCGPDTTTPSWAPRGEDPGCERGSYRAARSTVCVGAGGLCFELCSKSCCVPLLNNRIKQDRILLLHCFTVSAFRTML